MTKVRQYPNNLHHYRDEVLGWTKADLAQRAKLSDKTIKSMERDDKGSSTSRTRVKNAVNEGLRGMGKGEINDDQLWGKPDQPPIE